MAEKGVRNCVQLAAKATPVHEESHQNKKRYDRQPIILCRVGNLPPHHRHRRLQSSLGQDGPAPLVRETECADESHRKYDRDTNENQSQNKAEPDDRGNHARSSRKPGLNQMRIPVATIAMAVEASEPAMNQPI